MKASATGALAYRAPSTPGPALTRLGVIVLLLLVWEVAARFGDRLFVAPPSATAMAIFNLVGDKRLMTALGTALWELVVAFLIAAIIGGAIGLLVGRSRIANSTVYPIVLFLYSLPQAPLLPLFVLAFGIGPASKIAFGVSHGIFAMIVTVAAGVRDIDPALLKAARSMGARGVQMLWSVVLPSATASFFTGLRLAMSGVLLGVLLAELFVSQAGIGFYTHRFADGFQPANLFALISMLAAIAVILNEICRLGENWFNRWRA
jgi:ABC-type nitrate/sulfonate/bicarbonate transport system permease component